MYWLYVSLILCFFGFLKEIRPSEPFVTDYMMYPWRNITEDEVMSFEMTLIIPYLCTTLDIRFTAMSTRLERTHMLPNWSSFSWSQIT